MTVIVPYVQLNITLNCHSPFGNRMVASQENVLHVIFFTFHRKRGHLSVVTYMCEKFIAYFELS